MRERSHSYPIFDLAVAYRILRQELAGLGIGEHDRPAIFFCLGHTAEVSGGAARKVAALLQYGLLNQRGSLYGLSPLGLRVQRLAEGDPEFRSALSVCLENPPLFRRILERFRSAGRLPKDLSSTLKDLDITAKASTEAAAVFWRSAVFAGVLAVDGRLIASQDEVVPAASTPDADQIPQEGSEFGEVPMVLGNGRMGLLRLPKDISLDDLPALEEAWISAKRHFNVLPQSTPSEASEPKPGSTLRFPPRR